MYYLKMAAFEKIKPELTDGFAALDEWQRIWVNEQWTQFESSLSL